MDFSELPEKVRIKLTKKGEEEFWHRVDEFGGVKNFSEAFSYSRSKMYNWKNKHSFIPVELVRKVFGSQASEEVEAYKGGGRSKPVENPVIPLPVENELLTRIDESVVISGKTPVYQTGDRDLIKRFKQLLTLYGDVPYKVYNRSSVYELRYPLYFHKILKQIDYQKDFAALVDETGKVENGLLKTEDRNVKIEDFSAELYSRKKALKLALAREDNEKVRELMMREAEKVENVFNR